MRDEFGIEMPPTERGVTNTKIILDLLECFNVKGTFFVLGIIGEHFPDLVKEIHSRNHEIGVHGYNHFIFDKMDREKAFEEISRAKKLLEDLTGDEIYGHRAPAFSINESTSWGLDVVREAGFLYDSSIMPIDSKRYGWPGQTKEITTITTPLGKNIIEAPLSTSSLLGQELPACGGRYLQFLPAQYTEKNIKHIIKTNPAIMYLHPYDIDRDRYPDYYFEQLNLRGPLRRLKSELIFFSRKSLLKKIRYLLKQFEFDTLHNIICEKVQSTNLR
jgi:polysaccharide deacetylase family protein (PEP-CTERM system associated)